MRKLLNSVLALSVVAAGFLFTACDKGTTGEEVDKILEYTFENKPLYAEATASKPGSIAIVISEDEGGYLTYGQVASLLPTLIAGVETGSGQLILYPDNTFEIKDEEGIIVFPDHDNGFPPNFITYTKGGRSMNFHFTSDAVNALLDIEELDQTMEAQIKEALQAFSKGFLIYSAADNTIDLKLAYSKKGTTASIYLDKPLIAGTLECLSGLSDDLLEGMDLGYLEYILDKDFMSGFSKFNVGAKAEYREYEPQTGA